MRHQVNKLFSLYKEKRKKLMEHPGWKSHSTGRGSTGHSTNSLIAKWPSAHGLDECPEVSRWDHWEDLHTLLCNDPGMDCGVGNDSRAPPGDQQRPSTGAKGSPGMASPGGDRFSNMRDDLNTQHREDMNRLDEREAKKDLDMEKLRQEESARQREFDATQA